ncbi:MAG: anti-sigma F factor [Lachnospiraceae bacterium]|nr:anti-sigma F factor [Lachnospiraceae bacterium]MBQ6993935.1 anti-sigma F factor [Lachnospiraceae bacterium]
MKEEMKLEFDAISENEGLARVVIAAFLTRLDPTLEQLQDVKTAVSEAVTNAVIHGYEEKGGKIRMSAVLEKGQLEITIEDDGIGIEDVSKAMQPLFTTKPEGERSGMGFSFMEAFMDKVMVESSLGNGTTVHMWKSFQENILSQSKFLYGQV